jgi:cytochrome c oxidase subunit 3
MAHYHPYHIVEPSPYPYMAALSLLGVTVGAVLWFHSYAYGNILSLISFLFVASIAALWWRDIAREATYQGHHTLVVQRGLKYGMIFFIVSEVWFFIAFFWAFFGCSLAPDISIGGVWPPVGIQVIDPFAVPLLNTAVLLSSGATVTWSHHAMIAGNRKETILALVITVVLAAIFTGLQAMEYLESSFSIADSIYGTVFFLLTGFHGFHVIVGTVFLTVALGRCINHHFTKNHHSGFEAAIWYWHFVDYVWLGLFISVYWWGS